MGSADNSKEYPCLVRVTNGKEIKVSTRVRRSPPFHSSTPSSRPCPQVMSSSLDKFLHAYGTLLKGSMGTLRKRDKKREKLRAEQAAARKRRLAEAVVVEGPKRGNGRKKRQRKAKAAAKREEVRKRVQEKEDAKAKARAS
ncbi:hypothetical protein OF83DRAFT_1152856 [Amylostereum chailletii]|nr:hypothetical protein OF83DRAFT_1152856 [Amylostereum chailletii]